MPFELIRTDIVRMEVDAIVNAANSSLAPGGGVCGAIFSAAGHDQLEQACRSIGHCDVGQAVLTPGYQLPAKYVIHAVGPIWQGGKKGEAALLESAYRSALTLAHRKGCRSIAFPLISSGIYGYPKEDAFRIAVNTIQDFLLEHEMRVYLIVFGRSSVVLGEKLFSHIQSYIDDHYVEAHSHGRRRTEAFVQRRQLEEQEDGAGTVLSHSRLPGKKPTGGKGCRPSSLPGRFEKAEDRSFDTGALPSFPGAAPPSADFFPPAAEPSPAQTPPAPKKRSLTDLLFHLEDSFSDMLLRLIDEKGMTDVEVYKRANLDRKLFSKLRKSSYRPSKQTALALAIALRLNLDETRDLLSRSGYALSPASRSDVIIRYFIEEGIYDIYTINEALFSFGEKLLGAS